MTNCFQTLLSIGLRRYTMFIIPVAAELNKLLIDPGAAYFKSKLCRSYQNGGLCRKAGRCISSLHSFLLQHLSTQIGWGGQTGI